MKTKDIEFNADDLVGSVEAFAHHLTGKQKLTLRTATRSRLTQSAVRNACATRSISARGSRWFVAIVCHWPTAARTR